MTALIAIPRLPEGVEEDRKDSSLPAMPALTRLLRRARRLPDAPDWQAGVMQALGMDGVPAAAVAAGVLPALPPGSAVCFAAPVHAVAGLSRVHLPPGGRLELEAGEDAAWRDAFNEEFATAGAFLHAATEEGGWLLVAPCAGGACDASPELLAGAALERAPARDEAQRALRRLGTEVEMWLASHPLNRRREHRGEPVLNAIWFWGGARSQALPVPGGLRGVVTGRGGDAWLAGLAAWAGHPVMRFSSWEDAAQASPGLLSTQGTGGLVLIVPEVQAAGPSAGSWQELEQHWFARAEQAQVSGAIDTLQLQLGGASFQVHRHSLRHWLRWGRRPWWQMGSQS